MWWPVVYSYMTAAAVCGGQWPVDWADRAVTGQGQGHNKRSPGSTQATTQATQAIPYREALVSGHWSVPCAVARAGVSPPIHWTMARDHPGIQSHSAGPVEKGNGGKHWQYLLICLPTSTLSLLTSLYSALIPAPCTTLLMIVLNVFLSGV